MTATTLNNFRVSVLLNELHVPSIIDNLPVRSLSMSLFFVP
jgi:hypothetical protein